MDKVLYDDLMARYGPKARESLSERESRNLAERASEDLQTRYRSALTRVFKLLAEAEPAWQELAAAHSARESCRSWEGASPWARLAHTEAHFEIADLFERVLPQLQAEYTTRGWLPAPPSLSSRT